MLKLEEQILDYDKIPRKYRIGKSPDDTIMLYRGDIIDILESNTIVSKALQAEMYDEIEKAKEILTGNDFEQISKLIDRHTSSSYNSPLISLTQSPEMAQSFATRDNTTIYEIRIKANRLIFDVDDIGCTGSHKEYFAIGGISASEITAVKINNDDLNSELFFTDKNGTSWIRRRPSETYSGQPIKDRNNWRQLN